MNTTNPPPPGWYPDPAGRAPFRYWDGMRWTEHVQQGTAPAPAPSPGVPVAPAPPAPHHAAGPYAPAAPYAGQQPAPAGYGPGAQPAAGPTGPLSGQAFVAELKRFDGWAIVVVGFVLLVVSSFLPWVSSKFEGFDNFGNQISEDDSSNAWSGEAPWLLRGYDVDQQLTLADIKDSGSDMVLLFPIALAAVAVAVAVRNGKRFERSAEIGLGLAAAVAIGLIAEAVHLSGAADDVVSFGFATEAGLSFGIFGGILGGLLMAVGAGRTYMASRQPTR